MNKQVEANLSMIVSKALGGFNMNALKPVGGIKPVHT